MKEKRHLSVAFLLRLHDESMEEEIEQNQNDRRYTHNPSQEILTHDCPLLVCLC